mmetsp:Transcript_4697/g.9487  ORF Transcript_4697/g.9487 Transcript_4697/m.9487 type:complete len:109 (+) Transcript_4697:2328-2654(+)
MSLSSKQSNSASRGVRNLLTKIGTSSFPPSEDLHGLGDEALERRLEQEQAPTLFAGRYQSGNLIVVQYNSSALYEPNYRASRFFVVFRNQHLKDPYPCARTERPTNSV